MLDSQLVILFFAALIAATISGAAGFGGALVLLPIVTAIVGVKAAIPILTIGQIFGNASRVWFGRKELRWKPILFFLVAAIPFTIFGSYLFVRIKSENIKIGIGVLLILIVIYRRIQNKNIALGNKGMMLGGGLTGFLSGIAGSAGPLGAAFFFSCNLTAAGYIASEAFTALSMHLTKTLVYNKFSLVGQSELLYGVFIGIAMIIGSWVGKKIITKLSPKAFTLLVESLLVISAIHLIISSI